MFVSFKRVTFDRCYKTTEPLALEMGLKSRNAIILVIYRPPKKLTGKYRLLLEEELSHIANWASLQYPTVIITGDLNLNRMEPSSPEGKLLLDLEVEQGLECMITEPTRIQIRGSQDWEDFFDVVLYLHTRVEGRPKKTPQ